MPHHDHHSAVPINDPHPISSASKEVGGVTISRAEQEAMIDCHACPEVAKAVYANLMSNQAAKTATAQRQHSSA